MGIIKAHKIWKTKRKDSDFNRIKINSSGSFHMKSNDLFDDKAEVKKYVKALNEALDKYNKNQKSNTAPL
ncbi:hypothetical protein LB467_15905 [Salegentibacter sp. JZCK2]|uniref:hypothetical protein n=1 Tax=Salegentibacter tibetensis TaxID=2873600 RepID=UPI001CCFFF97|nr:hypothetical protein [Salegentibacter tibetensis]MBZ9731179.1 hypothetical protein [Salegentibacter tibetensis]